MHPFMALLSDKKICRREFFFANIRESDNMLRVVLFEREMAAACLEAFMDFRC